MSARIAAAIFSVGRYAHGPNSRSIRRVRPRIPFQSMKRRTHVSSRAIRTRPPASARRAGRRLALFRTVAPLRATLTACSTRSHSGDSPEPTAARTTFSVTAAARDHERENARSRGPPQESFPIISLFKKLSSCLRCLSAGAESIFFTPSIAPDREPNAEEESYHETHFFRPDSFSCSVCRGVWRSARCHPGTVQWAGFILQRVFRQLIRRSQQDQKKGADNGALFSSGEPSANLARHTGCKRYAALRSNSRA